MTNSTSIQNDQTQVEGRHAGKVALVMGGARGIGAGIVRRLAAEGARVTFTYASATAEADALVSHIAESGGRAAAVKANSADRTQVREVISAVTAQKMRLDIVVSHAGGGTKKRPDDVTSVYGMTKGAVASLVRGMSRELGPRGITINNVQPGPVNTPANPEDGPFGDTLRATIPVGRFGRVDEVASLVSHLASDDGAYINGASLDIDGGYSA
ncbi:SDR family oxidoreductase [Citricoccus nitrophenolicus]